MKNFLAFFLIIVCVVSLGSCTKDPAPTSVTPDSTSQSAILTDMANNIIVNNYNDIDTKVQAMYNSIMVLEDSTKRTDANLLASQQAWLAARAAWESCEGFLLGPVESENIDPNIDTWPVSFSSLDSLLASNIQFSQQNIDSLDQDLKGFHPIEYLLYGQDGMKHASQLTPRELEFMAAVALNVKVESVLLVSNWDPQASGSYYYEFTRAGNGSNVYPTRRIAFLDVVRVMADICNEVGAEKLHDPFVAKDPSLEESPFSSNSINDFIHNIQGVQNIYLGMYGTAQGKGMSDLVRANNLSLDGEIKGKIAAAIASLQAITVPFGKAISEQPTQITNAMNTIGDLHDEIENKLVPFVTQYTN
jgi:putative iron-regulated protein